jgi:predicted metalloendopeptidase
VAAAWRELKLKKLTALSLTLALAACSKPGPDAGAPPAETAAPAGAIERPAHLGLYKENFGRDARAQDDFYLFVNGGWLDRTEIPSDRSRWGTFDELREQSTADVNALIEETAAARATTDDAEAAKIADLYASFMDEATVEAKGLTPIEPMLERIGQVSSHEELATLFGELHAAGAGSLTPMGFWMDLDFGDTERYALYFTQSGLGMPDRDYYLKDDGRFAETRTAYLAYVGKLFELAGDTPEAAAAAAERIVALETALAEPQWPRAERRDRQKTWNPTPVADLPGLAPDFPWPAFMAAAGLGSVERIVLREKSYFPAAAEVFAATPVDTWKSFLRFKVLDSTAPLLPAAFVDAHFDFRGRTLSGTPENQPRWKRAVETVEGALGEAVGRLYVAKHFSPDSKARMQTLVENLRTAFGQAIDQLDWMSEPTKVEARAKLANFGVKIGYPDKWRDYSALEIRADDLVGNVMRSRRFEYEYDISRLNGPVDRSEWGMTPQTVNAYYSPTRNEIVFPAAILQPPFFDPEADDAVNYGAIGGVIGHEFSHGFDDQGRRTDGKGLLRDWWTEEDDARYRARADRLVAQYDAYEPIEGMRINGRLSLGENIGDLAGLTMAYRAYQLSLDGGLAPVIEGYTGEQRFFLGWGQIWRTKYREDALRRQLTVGPHSPGQYRVNGIVTNMDGFFESFAVEESDAMWRAPEDRVRIW